MARPPVDWYQVILLSAESNRCVVDVTGNPDLTVKSCWFIVNGKKYLYRASQLPFDKIWLQAIYLKKGDKLSLLSDKAIKTLYSELDAMGSLIEEGI